MLAQQGLSWAQSSFDGRDGRLEGIADEDGAVDRAAEIVRAVWGVRVVDSRTQLIEQVDVNIWGPKYLFQKNEFIGGVRSCRVARPHFNGCEWHQCLV